jgi:hypothetical protein
MKRVSLTLAAVVGAALLVAAPVAAQTPAPAPKPKWVAPVKGIAEIGYLAPQTKVVGDDIITTMKIKNLSTGSVALLRVDEYWWDKANNPVGGDTYRHKKPLMPGEIITITLRTKKNPAMYRNQYQFSHANGTVKAKVLKTLPAT